MNLKNFCVCSIILISIHVATTQTQGFQQLWTWEGKIANNQAGAFITSCDANGDGHPDLVVTSLDKVYLFTLSTHSLFSTTPDWEANLPNNHLPSVNGLSVACADFNSDGYDDLAVGVWTGNDNYDIRIFNGTANSPQMDPYNLTFYSNTTAYWGYSLHPEDFNNDGKKDLAVGCLGDCGVYIYHQEGSGLSDTPVTTASLTPNILTFGSAVVSADFEGDHYPDLVIGARGYNDNSGAIHIAKITSSGIQSPLAWSYAGADTLDQVGYDLATGDFNGDGFLDIVTLSPGNFRVLIFYGTGSIATFPATPSVILTTQQSCTSIRSGNINHDSYDDFVVGSNSSNEIYVYYGAAVIMNNTAPVVTINGTSGAAGWSVAVMGNLDEISTSEIAWSSWKYTNVEVNEGLVTVGYNLAASPSPTPSSTSSRSPSPSTSSSTSSTPSSTPSTTPSITPSSTSSVSSIPTTSSTPSVTSSSTLKSSEIAAIATVVPIGALGMLGISFAVFRKKQLKENVEMEPVDTQRVDEEKATPTEPEENIPQKSSEETQVYESTDTSSSESESEPEHISESDSSSLVSSSFSD